MITTILLILFSEFWGITGQIFYKKSVNTVDTPDLRNRNSYLSFINKIIRMPTVWTGFGCVTVSLAIWLTALTRTDLSIVFPIDSMQYILTLIGAHIFLNEKIDRFKLAGTLLIIGGIVLVAMS